MDLKQTAYALDSTTIDLCLNLFPWARFRRTKGAIKLHTLLDLRGSIPAFISISHGKKADVRILDELVLEPGSFYVMDRGYVDFRRLYCFVLAAAFFVTRSKSGIQFNRLESCPMLAVERCANNNSKIITKDILDQTAKGPVELNTMLVAMLEGERQIAGTKSDWSSLRTKLKIEFDPSGTNGDGPEEETEATEEPEASEESEPAEEGEGAEQPPKHPLAPGERKPKRDSSRRGEFPNVTKPPSGNGHGHGSKNIPKPKNGQLPASREFGLSPNSLGNHDAGAGD